MKSFYQEDEYLKKMHDYLYIKYADNPERAEKEYEKLKRNREETSKYPYPYELDVGPATLIYIVVMVGSLIFKEFYYIWAAASMWYWPKVYRLFKN